MKNVVEYDKKEGKKVKDEIYREYIKNPKDKQR